MYRKLLRYLRPHWWRMAGNIASNMIASVLDGFSFTLLIPFLNELNSNPTPIPQVGFVSRLLNAVIGRFILGRPHLQALEMVIVAIGIVVVVKNVFVWIAGQFGASLQEYVTRDLRDGVFRHMQRLPLGYFHRTKVGQIIARIVSDTEQTKSLVTELVTRSIQNVTQIVVRDDRAASFRMSVQLTVLSLVIAPLLTLTLQPIVAQASAWVSSESRGLRRSDERVAGSDFRHSPREVVWRRAVRGSTVRRRESSLLGRDGQDQSHRGALAAAHRSDRHLDFRDVLILWIGAHDR